MSAPLRGKVALVTGGSRGLGRAIVERLAADGADVAFGYWSSVDEADALAARGAEWNVSIKGIRADLRADDGPGVLVQETVGAFGRLDIAVVNAAVWRRAPLVDVSPETFDELERVNVRAAYFTVQHVARQMLEAGNGGRIVVVTSRSAFRPRAGSSVYAMTKAAQRMLVRVAAAELGEHGITVNEVAPGPMETEMNRELRDDPVRLNALVDSLLVKRIGVPAEVARAVSFFVSDEAGYVTGATLNVDGGGAIA